MAVTYSFGPDSKAFAKQSSHERLKTLDNKPIPSSLILKSTICEVHKNTIRNKTLTKPYTVHVRVKLSKLDYPLVKCFVIPV